MQYCHECAETQIRFDLSLKKIFVPIQSNVKESNFQITLGKNTVIASVKDLTLALNNQNAVSFKDWNTFIQSLIADLEDGK